MDKLIEIMAYYWVDWQQTAILNTRYSVVLAALAFVLGGLIIAALKGGKIGRLTRQLTQEKQSFDKAEKTNLELLDKQRVDAEQVAIAQQQIEKVYSDLDKERQVHQSNLSEKDVLFIKAATEKQKEVEAINAMLDEKNLLTERLQGDLDNQKNKISQYAEVQEKMVEMEIKANQSMTEIGQLKQQLETELTNKNQHSESEAKVQVDRIADLELQLERTNHAKEAEKQQLLAKHESEKNQLELNRQSAESKAEAKIKPEQTVQQQIQQVATDSKKPESLSTKQAEPTNKKPPLSTKQNKEKQGIVSGVLGWFSSVDKLLDSDEPVESVSVEPVKVEPVKKDEPIEVVKTVEKVEQVVVEKKPVIQATPRPVTKIELEDSGSFSEKMAEVADTMDSFQDKLKGYFNKMRS